jgi:hypothetical protein
MPPSKEERMTPLRWVNLVALIGCLLGLLMAWGTAFIASVSGLDTDDGKLFGAVVVATALISLWRMSRTNRLNGFLVTTAWLGLVAFAVAEIIHVSSSQDVMVGTGLYVDAAAAVVGAITAVIDLARNWPVRKPMYETVPHDASTLPARVSSFRLAPVRRSFRLGPSKEQRDA